MSNLLEQASLVMIPSGYAEDIVYSEIPLDGAGDLSFTRASNGTRVNFDGLVEVVPWNLFGNSENGTSYNWGNPYNIGSVTLNSTTAPNGTNTGNLVVENSANTNHWFEQSFTAIVGTPYTISAYFKAKERTQCALYGFTDNFVFSGQLVIFNLSTGTVVSQSGTQTNAIENVGNGWYRCSMTITANASATAYFGYGLANGGSQSYQGDGTSGLYMWGRQLNTGTIKPYFPTTDRLNVPRLTYQNGGGGCPSLLLEKQSTNLVSYSQDFSNAYWSKLGQGVADTAVVTANYAISPDGTQNATRFVCNLNGGNTSSDRSWMIVSFTAQATSTISIWIKLNSAGTKTVLLSDSGGGTKTISGTDWQRIDATFVGASGEFRIGLIGGSTSDTLDCCIWGAQAEASSYPTSYIPTTSASATRVADACFRNSYAGGITSEGTIFADFEYLRTDGGYSTSCLIYNGGLGNYIYLYVVNNSIRALCANSAVAQSNIISSTVTANTRYKVAARFKTNDFSLYVNGALIGTDTSGTMPTFSTSYNTYVGTDSSFTEPVGKLNELVIFPVGLTDSELASLTTL